MTNRITAVSIALALCIGIWAVPARGYPGYWANIAKLNCTRVPASSRDLSSSPHSAPQINSGLKFELRTASTGRLVSSLCPGGSYKLKLVFPASGTHYLLVSTQGSFNDSSVCGKVGGCPNRACNCSANRRDDDDSLPELCPLSGKEVEHALVMPANDSLSGTTNVFQALFITNAIGGLGPLQMNSASINFTCVPTLVNSVNATRLQVNQTSTLRIRADNTPRPRRASSTGPTKAITATVTSTPAGIVACTPAKPRFGANNVATTSCRARKTGVATVVVTYAGVTTTRVLRVV